MTLNKPKIFRDIDTINASLGEKANQSDVTASLALKANQSALDSTNTNKVDKNGSGQVTYANLAQDAREQITGGNTAVVGNDAVLNQNIVNNTIKAEKMYGVGAVNLLDTNLLAVGSISGSSGTFSGLNINTSNTSMRYMPNIFTLPKSGKILLPYDVNAIGYIIMLWDSTQTQIDAMNATGSKTYVTFDNTNGVMTIDLPTLYTAKPTAVYATFGFYLGGGLEQSELYIYINCTELPNEYVKFEKNTITWLSNKNDNYEDSSISVEKTDFIHSNSLYNSTTSKSGVFVNPNNNGIEESNAGFFASDYIRVYKGHTYYIYCEIYCIYDMEKAYQSGLIIVGTPVKREYIATADGYLKFSTRTSYISTAYCYEDSQTSGFDVSPALLVVEDNISDALKEKLGFNEVNPNINGFGDSLTAGAGGGGTTYLSVLSGLLPDYVVNNYGIGGEGIEQIAGRQGGIPMYVEPFTIPADTTATVIALKNVIGSEIVTCLQGTNGVNPVTINGITGSLSATFDDGYTNIQMYFTRSASGNATEITRPTRVFTSGSNATYGTLILWAGTNDKPDSSSINDVIKCQRDMIRYANTENYIVIGFTALPYMPEIVTVNKILAREYGDHFIDIRTYLLNYGLADASITPTTQDTTDIANGEIPTSLRSDAIHFNATGYTVIANVIYLKGIELGYWS